MSENISETTIKATLEKLEKLKLGDKLHAELTWCWNSYLADKNPEGVKEKCAEAVALFKAKRQENSRAISKKLVEDLEKIASK